MPDRPILSWLALRGLRFSLASLLYLPSRPLASAVEEVAFPRSTMRLAWSRGFARPCSDAHRRFRFRPLVSSSSSSSSSSSYAFSSTSCCCCNYYSLTVPSLPRSWSYELPAGAGLRATQRKVSYLRVPPFFKARY
jgi:hypothetical protein